MAQLAASKHMEPQFEISLEIINFVRDWNNLENTPLSLEISWIHPCWGTSDPEAIPSLFVACTAVSWRTNRAMSHWYPGVSTCPCRTRPWRSRTVWHRPGSWNHLPSAVTGLQTPAEFLPLLETCRSLSDFHLHYAMRSECHFYLDVCLIYHLCFFANLY